MSIRLKLTVMFLAITAIPLLLVSSLTYVNFKNSLESARISSLQDIGVFKADKIETYFAGLNGNMEVAQTYFNVKKNLPALTALSDEPNHPDFLAAEKMLDEQLRRIQSVLGLADIMLVEPGGKLVYSSNREIHVKDFLTHLPDPGQKAFKQGKTGIYFSDIFLYSGPPVRFEVLVTAPAYDFNGVFIGVIAFEVDMAQLYKLVQDATGLGETGETLLGKKTGNEIVYLSPLRHDPNAALKRKIPLGQEIGGPIQEAVQGRSGAGQLIDYRGKKVIAAWRYLPFLDWGMVAKIDSKEAFADVTNLRNLSAIILIIILTLSGIMAFSIAKSISEPIKRLSKGAEIVGSGNLDHTVGTTSNDEIGQLSRTFDKMTEDLKMTLASRDELNREIDERKKAEQSLRESQADLNRAQAVAVTGSWHLDVLQNKLNWSDEAHRIFAVPQGSPLTYEVFLAAIHPDDRDFVDKSWKAALQGAPYDIEQRIIVDGKVKWVREKAELDFDEHGALVGGFGTVQDITERKRSEEAIKQSESRYKSIVSTALDGFWHIDTQGRIIDVNPAACTLLGYNREELLKLRVLDIEAVENPEEVKHHIEKMIATGGDLFESKHKRKDGAIIDVEISTSFTRDAQGERVFIFIRDITERKRAEQERETTIEFLRIVNESTETSELIQKAATFFQRESGCEAVGIRLKDGDDYPYYEVRGFPEDFVRAENSLCTRDSGGSIIRDSKGYPIHECMCGNILHGRFDTSKPFFTEHGSFWTNSTTELLATTSEADRQARTRNRCNGEGYESVALLPLHIGEQRLGLVQLNDKRKGQFSPELIALWERLADYFAVALAKFEAEDALRETSENLVRSNKELEQFAYIASHDLQEPLRVITGYIQLIAKRYKGRLDPDADDFINFAVEGANRMQSLIMDLLTYSRVIKKAKPFAEFDSGLLLTQALANLEAAIKEADAVITHDPLPTVTADGVQLVQVFQNLIGNAVKFSGKTRPEIYISARHDENEWIFSVKDNGIGIESAYKDRIFVIFQRLHSREEYPGTGMGLSICQKIVERHGGRIWVESEPGKGSTFHFTILDKGD